MSPGPGPQPTPGPWNWNRVLTPRAVLLVVFAVALVMWAYWWPLYRWEVTWANEAAWGHGYLIPVIAILIAHYRFQQRNPQRVAPCTWGLLLVLGGLAVRVWAQVTMFAYPGDLTFLMVAGGTALALLGWDVLKVLWIPIAYLWLMIPWPQYAYDQVALPAQRMAAAMTEVFLRLVGMSVTRAGNVLTVFPSPPIGVAEACSGLRLLLAFVALGAMMAFISPRPAWKRVLIIGSSAPIAVFCNFIRVTLMAVSSNAIFVEAERLAAAAPTWSTYLPRVASWSSLATTGVVLGLGGIFVLIMHDRLVRLSRRDALLLGGGLVAAGVILTLQGATFVKGYQDPAQLEAVRQIVLDPESAPHQAYGFAMLGLAFVLMWVILRGAERLADALFIHDEDAAPPGPSPAAPGRSPEAGGPKQDEHAAGPARKTYRESFSPRRLAWAAAALLVVALPMGAWQAVGLGDKVEGIQRRMAQLRPDEAASLEAMGEELAVAKVNRTLAWISVGVGAAAVGLLVAAGGRAGSPWLVAAALVPITFWLANAAYHVLARVEWQEMLINYGHFGAVVAAAVMGLAVVRRHVARPAGPAVGGRGTVPAPGAKYLLNYASCCGVLLTAALFFTVWDPPPPTPLAPQQPIGALEARLTPRGWQGTHQPISETLVKILGADEYVNLVLVRDDRRREATLFVPYNASAMSKVPHLPQVCMQQSGYDMVRIRQDSVVIDEAEGKEVPVNVMLFEPGPQLDPRTPRALMFQYFCVGGTYTTHRQTARFLGTTGSLGRRGSYLTQTQLAIYLAPDEDEAFDRRSAAYLTGVDILKQVVPILEDEYYPKRSGPEGGGGWASSWQDTPRRFRGGLAGPQAGPEGGGG